jgi:hypothetical protein
MTPNDALIEEVKRQYDACIGWGDSGAWTNRDFIDLSERCHCTLVSGILIFAFIPYIRNYENSHNVKRDLDDPSFCI